MTKPNFSREPEFTTDRTTVFLHGYYTFDQLLAISMDDRLSSKAGLASVQDVVEEED